MIRAILISMFIVIMSFNFGRVYEYGNNVPAYSAQKEIVRIATALEVLPVRAMK